MKNKDKIDMFELLLEILQSAEEKDEEVKIWGYDPENKYIYGFINFRFKEDNYTMFFENGMLREIRKGIL